MWVVIGVGVEMVRVDCDGSLMQVYCGSGRDGVAECVETGGFCSIFGVGFDFSGVVFYVAG